MNPALVPGDVVQGARPHFRPARPAAVPTEPDETFVRVRVWDRIVRITHWVIALSIVVLATTGIYIGKPFLIVPGVAGDHFVMGTIKIVHFYAAIAFTLAVGSRLAWMFVGTTHARWYNFIPFERDRRLGLIGTLKFYMFLRRKPPPFVGHNPVAGMAYAAVFGLYLVMILTGLGLYSVDAAPGSIMTWFHFLLAPFGGPQLARWVHHVVMWLLLGFFVQHLYSAWLVATIERTGTLDSIFTGYKWIEKKDAGDKRNQPGPL